MTTILGSEAAERELDTLLSTIRSELEAVRNSGVQEQRQATSAAKQKLRDFVKSTQPQNPGDPAEAGAVDKVDQVAFDVLIQLGVQQIQQDIQRIEAGAAKLQALTPALGAQTAANVSSARSISLQPIKATIDSMTTMVELVKSLKSSLSAANPDEARIAAEIQKLVEQFEALRSAVSAVN